MTDKGKKPVKPVTKPFLTGSVTDEQTPMAALGFFGVLILAAFMTFIVCGALTMDSAAVRIALNAAVEILVLLVMYNSAVHKGAEAVARGEILYQKQEKGREFSASERSICFHPGKGFVNALLGTLPVLICAVILAIVARRQTTGAGSLPNWLSAYQGRSDISCALAAYNGNAAMGLEDILRIVVRVSLMPFVSILGSENPDGMLTLERLSPVLVLLPAMAYGLGYLRGWQERTKIHTGIAESNTRRARRERKARKARMARTPKGPEQLN